MRSVADIDVSARAQAARLVHAFAAGEIDNDELEDRYPLGSRDPGVKAIWWQVWSLYSDFATQRVGRNLQLDAETRELIDRCGLFLQSTLPYGWPRLWFKGLLSDLQTVPLLGRLARRRLERWDAAGDPSVWPFLQRGDLEAARGRPFS